MTTIQDIADKMGVSKSTVSKALNDAPDISDALRKQVLETAVALGYTKLRRYKKPTKKVCIIIEKENMRYQEPHHFAYDILVGFRQMAEPAGFDVEIVPVDIKTQRNQHYDVFMLEHDYIGAFVVGFSLSDPWIQDFKISRTPAVLFDNYIVGNPSTAYVGIDNEEGMELAVSYLAGLGHRKIAYLSSSLGARVLQARHAAFLRSMHQHGLKTSPAAIGCSYYLSECMEKHLPRFLENGITAIICNQVPLLVQRSRNVSSWDSRFLMISALSDLMICRLLLVRHRPLQPSDKIGWSSEKVDFLHCQVFSITSQSVRICCMHS